LIGINRVPKLIEVKAAECQNLMMRDVEDEIRYDADARIKDASMLGAQPELFLGPG